METLSLDQVLDQLGMTATELHRRLDRSLRDLDFDDMPPETQAFVEGLKARAEQEQRASKIYDQLMWDVRRGQP